MNLPVVMAEVWRGGFLESVDAGHAVICDASGAVVAGLHRTYAGDGWQCGN
ncbi:MAG: hypothetical protein ACC619_09360 [Paracoccaceae bacterium]